ncbi:MAG: hypothetical protein ACAI44_01235 [Candidatus Sericytochromatia bacterium]
MGNFNRLGQAVPQFQLNGRPALVNPSQLFGPALQQPAPRLNQVSSRLNQVSSLLGRQDQVQTPFRPNGGQAVLHPLFQQGQVGTIFLPPRQSQIHQVIVSSGLREWQQGVRESGGANRGARINQYAANAEFGPGYEWCGFFTAWNYSQAGFQYPEHFASYQKARDFFLYRSFTSRDPGLHRQQDQLRVQQQAEGSSRQYFIMAGSPTYDYVRDHPKYYAHVNLAAMTHSWQSLPIQPGDVALFSHGHVATVVSYDRNSGRLETVEGNTSGTGPDGKFRSQAVVRKSYELSQADDRAKFDGFGRAAQGDFK